MLFISVLNSYKFLVDLRIMVENRPVSWKWTSINYVDYKDEEGDLAKVYGPFFNFV